MKDSLLLGFARNDAGAPSLEEVLSLHARVRDATTQSVHGELDIEYEPWPYIATLSFTYAFNAFKAVGLLLPQLYSEAAAAVLRQMWEVSLNLHWLEADSEPRCRDFCNFTLMEYRGQMVAARAPARLIEDFDSATVSFQKRFRFLDKNGRTRRHDHFSASSVRERASQLGAPWESDYQLIFRLTSMHVHGAPGAILHPLFKTTDAQRQASDRVSSALIGLVATQLLVRNVHLLVRNEIVPDADGVDQAFRGDSWQVDANGPAPRRR